MSNHFEDLRNVDQAEFQAIVAAAMRKAHRERSEAVGKIFTGFWHGLRRAFGSAPHKHSMANHEHRNLIGCS